MRADIRDIIKRSLAEAGEEGLLGIPGAASRWPDIIVERPRKEAFGDFSTNIAMLLAPFEKRPPREIAEMLAAKVARDPKVLRCEVAGPGFINIFIEKGYWVYILDEILKRGHEFGSLDIGAGQKVQVEFVSANPTGPLHIGHGRGAAVGDAVANILRSAGYDVTKEFYINDVGRQMEVLGRSVRVRYLELLGVEAELPEDAYRGEYIRAVARDFIAKHGESYRETSEAEALPVFTAFASRALLGRIERDLKDFGVGFEVWYSEKTLYEKGLVDKTIAELREKDFVYDSEGAVWFKTTEFGDDKDRVLVKADGAKTYFASDIAYHREKVERGFDKIIDVWGADHHGYEARVRSLFKALGLEDETLKVIFIQLVSLLRGGVPVAMGKRTGEFVTLRQVMDEVGPDACRFFFLMRKADAQLDFDLELAKSQAPENPVYYVQYCHARIQSIFDYAKENGVEVPESFDAERLKDYYGKDEIEVVRHLGSFEEVVEKSAKEYAPHKITFYLMELAGIFHPYYNRNRVVAADEPGFTEARLMLCKAVKTVAANGLKLLGVAAPDKM